MRKSGILNAHSSLPSEFGNRQAGRFGLYVCQLPAGLRCPGVQILPLSPTSYGDSPYQSFSVHAGNPYFIDFQRLEKKAILRRRTMRILTGAMIPAGSTTPECITTVSTYSGPHTAVSGRTIRLSDLLRGTKGMAAGMTPCLWR